MTTKMASITDNYKHIEEGAKRFSPATPNGLLKPPVCFLPSLSSMLPTRIIWHTRKRRCLIRSLLLRSLTRERQTKLICDDVRYIRHKKAVTFSYHLEFIMSKSHDQRCRQDGKGYRTKACCKCWGENIIAETSIFVFQNLDQCYLDQCKLEYHWTFYLFQ